MSLPAIEPEALRELQHIDGRHELRMAIFSITYLASAALAIALSSAMGGGWLAVVACAPLYVLAGASLHGLSLFTHEGVHGTLAGSPFWNRTLSIACALPVMQNFAAYKVLHLRHHADTGGSIDPDHYGNYSGRSRSLFLMHWTRLLVGYPVYIVAIPILALRHARRDERLWTLFESGLLLVLVVAVVASPVPWSWILHGWLLPMVCINTMVNIRGMSQHTLLEEPIHSVRGTRTILARPLVAFFMCNENYHLEHHLYPRVPWYNLPRLHAALKPQLVEAGAPFIPSYSAFLREFAVRSLDLWRGAKRVETRAGQGRKAPAPGQG